MKRKPNKALGLTLMIAGVISFVMVLGSFHGSNSSARDSYARSTTLASESSTLAADSFASSTGSSLDQAERQNFERDPSSMGYSDADRDFLREHGLSEDEARAAETILQQQGIE